VYDNAAAVKRVTHVLGHGRAGVVTDIDGTISRIVARPEDAYVLPQAREALQELKTLIAVVAVVTGRSVLDARQMVDLEGLTYVGNHGMELWRDGKAETVPEARPWVPRLAAVIDDVRRQISEDGVIVENKGASASLHYRLATDPEKTRLKLLEILARCAVTNGIRLEEGRMVINLLPPLTVSKGSAVTWLVREHDLDGVVYFGDDLTDAHAFRAIEVLRQTGDVQGLGIAVVGAETPPSVRQLADLAVPSVAAVAEVLCHTAEALRSSATMGTRARSVGK
jgi:trehalose 6-phosphate phosphatase